MNPAAKYILPVLPVTDFILQFPFTVIKMTCIYNDDLKL
ncbi:hypothetical protein H253_1556 [Klebsiella pneumoniae KP-7]|nr:hypothetical protein H253_1556 [Klebsiella pneumoniae KP-7]EOZ77500.1 hypothetical protein H254_1186 [Klebsiella pneumoniae KP-11]